MEWWKGEETRENPQRGKECPGGGARVPDTGNEGWRDSQHKRAIAKSPATSTMMETSEGVQGRADYWEWSCFHCRRMKYNNHWMWVGCEWCDGTGDRDPLRRDAEVEDPSDEEMCTQDAEKLSNG